MLEMEDVDYLKSRLAKDVSMKYWSENLLDYVFSANSYKELGGIALDFVESMPRPVEQVLGPITSGGYGSIKKNLYVLESAIRELMDRGRIIFNQLPFESPLMRIRAENLSYGRETQDDLLNQFYLPIFKSGLITKVHFIYGWRSSYDSIWEHEKAKKLGIEINYLERNFYVK